MVGIVITVFNRLEYTKQCIDSLMKANLSDCSVVIVDDCSTDGETPEYLHELAKNKLFTVLKTSENKGVSGALMLGLNHVFEVLQLPFGMVLDNDMIVKPDFVQKLMRVQAFNYDRIISGFNTNTTNEKGRVRHIVVRKRPNEGYVEKRSIGGANMLFGKKVFYTFIKPALHRCSGKYHNWDTDASRRMAVRGLFPICLIPSVVSHIGIESTFEGRNNPDTCSDFDENKQAESEKRKVFINQPFGIGDCIFAQGIAMHYINLGMDVYWAVEDMYLDGLKRAYPRVNWIARSQSPVPDKIRGFQDYKGYYVVPIRFSDSIMRVPYKEVMRAKYDMIGLNWTIWSKHAMFERDYDREEQLADLLGANGEYHLVNTNYKGVNLKTIDINLPENRLKTIKMGFVDGYSLFDWMGIIENATEITTVSTSIVYLLELIPKLKCVPEIRLRLPDEINHDNYMYIMTRNKYYFTQQKENT